MNAVNSGSSSVIFFFLFIERHKFTVTLRQPTEVITLFLNIAIDLDGFQIPPLTQVLEDVA
jgi:hypothetical protein